MEAEGLYRLIDRLLEEGFSKDELEDILCDYEVQTSELNSAERAKFVVMHEDDIDGG